MSSCYANFSSVLAAFAIVSIFSLLTNNENVLSALSVLAIPEIGLVVMACSTYASITTWPVLIVFAIPMELCLSTHKPSVVEELYDVEDYAGCSTAVMPATNYWHRPTRIKTMIESQRIAEECLCFSLRALHIQYRRQDDPYFGSAS